MKLGGWKRKKSNREREAPAGISCSSGRDRNAWGVGGGAADEKVAEKCLIKIFEVTVGEWNGNSSSCETL